MAIWYEPNLLIDGELVAAEGGASFASINPATEEVIAEAADASLADVDRAIAAARRAFDETTWSTDAKFRATCLRQLATAMRDNLEDLRTLTVAEVGVPVGMTTGPALEGPIALLDYYADLAESYETSTDLGFVEAYGSQHRRWIEREPYGVVERDLGVQLPDPAQPGQARSGARRRMHRGAEGCSRHAADHAGPRQADRREHRHPRRRRQRAHVEHGRDRCA